MNGRRSAARLRALLLAMTVVALTVLAGAGTAAAAARHAPSASAPGVFGPNVVVFNPSMPQSQIQARLDDIANQQVPHNPVQTPDPQFSSQRYAILFEPGTYGSAADPLVFQVGYYTQVAGLGATPSDVVINGVIDSFNRCSGSDCNALDNFWRSLSNLTINDTPSANPSFTPSNGENDGCKDSNEMWAVSQAAPMRRVIVHGTTTLFDYCGSNDSSGGYLGDDTFSGQVINGSQQQFFTRNSNLGGGWSNSVWNQVFMGDNGAPPQDFGGSTGNQYTTLATSPVAREQPFIYSDRTSGSLRVFVPAARHDSTGPDYSAGPAAGNSVPIDDFFIADPSTPTGRINAALARGLNLIFEPGVYSVDQTITVRRPDTIVMGLGFATLIPEHGNVAMSTADVPGVEVSGLIFDAGPRNSSALLQVGFCRAGRDVRRDNRGAHDPQGRGCDPGATADASDPTLLSDVFFRIGGAEPGRATDALVVNADNAILDDIWAWRADHGAGVGWTSNTSATGLLVNGDNVSAYGLAVEHFQKEEVLWNGQNGRDVFFQNEMPYDPPSQAAWMETPTTKGYPAFRVGSGVTRFSGYGMGSYSFFNQHIPIYSDEAFAAPVTAGVSFHDLLTIFLDKVNGSGGILSVINGVGGASTAANADTPVDVVNYP